MCSACKLNLYWGGDLWTCIRRGEDEWAHRYFDASWRWGMTAMLGRRTRPNRRQAQESGAGAAARETRAGRAGKGPVGGGKRRTGLGPVKHCHCARGRQTGARGWAWCGQCGHVLCGACGWRKLRLARFRGPGAWRAASGERERERRAGTAARPQTPGCHRRDHGRQRARQPSASILELRRPCRAPPVRPGVSELRGGQDEMRPGRRRRKQRLRTVIAAPPCPASIG